MDTKSLVIAVLFGIAVTILTGLIDLTPPMLLGASHYGYPFSWLTRLIIAPEYFPWRVRIPELIGDIIVWSIIGGVILLVLKRTRK
jgi:hypothetical protein